MPVVQAASIRNKNKTSQFDFFVVVNTNFRVSPTRIIMPHLDCFSGLRSFCHLHEVLLILLVLEPALLVALVASFFGNIFKNIQSKIRAPKQSSERYISPNALHHVCLLCLLGLAQTRSIQTPVSVECFALKQHTSQINCDMIV